MSQNFTETAVGSPPVVLTLIEGFLLSGPGGRMEISSAKAQAMFAHLALSPNMEQTRERLAGLLWGGDD